MITGKGYVIIEWVLLSLCLFLCVLRIFLRRYRLGISDFFVVCAWIVFAAQACMDTSLIHYGWYHDQSRIDGTATVFFPENPELATYEDTIVVLKIVYAETVLYYTEMYCVKFAMLAFYYEVFPPSLKKLQIMLHITTVFTFLCWIMSFLVKALVCQPVSSNWIPGPHWCSSEFSMISNVFEWSFHVFTDLLIYFLPLYLLPKLKVLPLPQKIGVGITFSVGFVCIAFANLFQVSTVLGQPITIQYLYSSFEQSWAIFVVCCPAFKTLLTRRGRQGLIKGYFTFKGWDTGRSTTTTDIKTRYSQIHLPDCNRMECKCHELRMVTMLGGMDGHRRQSLSSINPIERLPTDHSHHHRLSEQGSGGGVSDEGLTEADHDEFSGLSPRPPPRARLAE